MKFLDWLLGSSDIGWLKTALLSGFLGILVIVIIFDADYENKFYAIFIGYPILWIIRRAYWNYRKEEIKKMETKAKSLEEQRELTKHKMSVMDWNPDLYNEL